MDISDNQENQQQGKKTKKPRKWLSAAFNMATGAGIAIGIKTAFAFGLACTTAPALAVTLGSAAAAGACLGLWGMRKTYKTEKAAGNENAKFWSWKKFITSTTLSTAGAGVVEMFGDQISDSLCSLFEKHTAPIISPEPVIEEIYPEIPDFTDTPDEAIQARTVLPIIEEFSPASEDLQEAQAIQEEPELEDIPPPPYEPSKAMLAASELIQADQDAPAKILERLEDAIEGDAQAQKDVAHYLFNDCNPTFEERHTAALLAQEAAEAGNEQAKEFWNFVRYWGMAGIDANKEEALAAMREVDTSSARHLVEQWAGDVPMEQVEPKPDCNKPAAATTEPVLDEAQQPSIPEQVSVREAQPQPDSQPKADTRHNNGTGCTAIIDIEEGISFLCDIPKNIDIQAGDTVTVEEPPVSAQMLLKDGDSAILHLTPRP